MRRSQAAGIPVLLAIATLSLPASGCAQDVADVDATGAREALLTGDYDAAVRAYRALSRGGQGLPESARGLARALAATGEYDRALAALEEAAAAAGPPDAVQLDRARGEILRILGRTDEAEAALRSAIAGGADDATLARLELAEILWYSGRQDEAIPMFDGFIDFYNAAADPSAEELMAVGTALTYLGRRDSQLFRDARRAFEEAISAAPRNPEPRVAMAELLLSKYNSREAGALLDEADALNPRHPRALLARARRAQFDGSYESIELTEKSLEINPNDPEARAFLARLFVELEDLDRAEAEARRALETNPASLEAWTELAAVAHLRSDEAAFEDARDRVLALNPTHAPLYEGLAEAAYRTHRYGDAVEFARLAVQLDNTSWSAYAALGLNELRLGDFEKGRATLESAFAGDPFNPWVYNTLELLDLFETFERTTSDRFVFYLHPDESDLLSIYAPALAEEAFTAMSARYGYEPPTPVSVEIYDQHRDFSVRTVGLSGIGALGVSFGSVLAMDSPGARSAGDFNWGSTLWHEISHAFTLGYTEHRVPRWLSEGLAVLDERHAREGWGSDVSPGFLAAFRDERLPSLERFNYGFVRPAYPGQVQHSYYMSSLLVEMIEERYGIEAIRSMLDGYRDGLETPAVFETVFGEDLAAFDRELNDYIGTRFASAIAALSEDAEGGGEYLALLTAAAAHRSEGRTEEAIAALERAREIFPEYAGPDAPVLALASLHADQGNDVAALEAYRAYVSLNENHLGAHVVLADLEEKTGNLDRMRATLDRSIWIDPYRPDLHRRLADAHEGAGEWGAGVRERRALLALDPTDRAEAYYRLALALFRHGDAVEARTTVLRALEIAPNYEDALGLLIEIRGGR